MEEAARTYAADLLQEYTYRIEPVIKSSSFVNEAWEVAETAQEPLVGTESISFPTHNLKLFSPNMLAQLEADMRDVALLSADQALPAHEVDCLVDLHEGEPHADPPIPVSVSTTFLLPAQAPSLEPTDYGFAYAPI